MKTINVQRLAGALVILVSFTLDYSLLVLRGLRAQVNLEKVLASYIPDKYNWFLFALGEAAVLASCISLFARSVRKAKA